MSVSLAKRTSTYRETFSGQEEAAALLAARGIYSKDMGYGFHVGGRFGRWMSPTEVLKYV